MCPRMAAPSRRRRRRPLPARRSAGCRHSGALRGTRYRQGCRPRQRGRHRARAHCLRRGTSRGRRVDQFVLRQPRRSLAAIESLIVGDAHRAGAGPGCLHLHDRPRLSQAPRRRLHHRQGIGLHRAAGAGLAALYARVHAHHPQRSTESQAAGERAVAARIARAARWALDKPSPFEADPSAGSHAE
jgi:hypothetical protein